MIRTGAENVPQVIQEWIGLARDVLGKEAGDLVDDDRIEQVSEKVIWAIIEYSAGVQWYVPAGYAKKISDRDQTISTMAEQGVSRDHICEQYQISHQTYYAILRRVKAIRLKEAQPDLFAEEANDS